MFKSFSVVAVIAGLTTLGKVAIDTASDLEEVQNVVDTSFGEASEEINEFAKNALKQFGLTELQAKKTASTLMAMSNAMGITAENGKIMSINLTKLSGDLASFYNVSQDVAETALQSVFTGETESLKKFGIVMTEANLSAFAMANGIRKAYSEMSQAEKVALRYNYVMSNTAKVQGDFAKTSNSWANQLRILKGQWSELIGIIGKGLIAVLTPLLQILNQVLASLIAIANAMAKAFGGSGIQKVSVSAGSASAGLGDASTGAEDLGDNLDTAEKKAKELEKTIAGFDELEIIKSNKDDEEEENGSGSGSGSGAGGGFGVQDYYGDITEGEQQPGIDFNEFLKRLDDFILEYTEKANEFGTMLGEKINEIVDYVDWDLLGKTIADGFNLIITTINHFMEAVDWVAIGEAFATGINSIFRNVKWDEVGKYIAHQLNYIGDIIEGFADTLDFQQAGESLKTAFLSAVENIDWAGNGGAFGNMFDGFVDAIKTFFEGKPVVELGQSFGEMINSALANIDATKLGETANLIVVQLIEAFEAIDFELLASKIRELLDALDIPGIIAEYLSAKTEFSGDIIGGFFDIPEGTANALGGVVTAIQALSTAIGALMPFLNSFLGIWTQLTIILGHNPFGFLATSLSSITGLFQTTIGEVGVFKGTFDGLSVLFDEIGLAIQGAGLKITDFFTVAKAGSGAEALASQLGMVAQNGTTLELVGSKLSIGMSNLWAVMKAHPILAIIGVIATLVTSFISAYNSSEQFRAKVDELWNNTILPVIEGLKEGLATLWNEHLQPLWEQLTGDGGLFQTIGELLKGLWDTLTQFIAFLTVELLPGIVETLGTILDAVMETVGDLADIISSLLDTIKGIIDFLVGVFTGDWEKAWQGIVDIFTGIFEALEGVVKGVINVVIGTINSAIQAVVSLVNLAVDALNTLQVTVPEWVPGIGGKTFGFNIPHLSAPSIPYLADGGVIDTPTVAMVGEYPGAKNNPEIVTPQNILKETINSGNEELISAMYQMCMQMISAIEGIDMNVTIDDEVIAQSASRGNKEFQRRTGMPLFA